MSILSRLCSTLQPLVFLAMISTGFQANGQNIVQQSLHLGAGSGYFGSQGPLNGCGVLVNAGWQKTLKKQNLRFSPDLTFGSYNNNCVEDIGDANYTAITLRGIFNHDFIQSNRFAAFIGGGAVVNYTWGEIIGSQIIPVRPGTDLPRNETQFHPGLAINVGLRFVPNSGRLGFEMIPVNVQFDFDDYSELIFYARFFYSLDARKSKKAEMR